MTTRLAAILLGALVAFIGLAIYRFGLVDGLLISLGVYLLMPYAGKADQ